MQLYALDQYGDLLAAVRAERRADYFCLECGAKVRLRSGPHRQPHFFHLVAADGCSQHGKSMTHLQIQRFLEKLLGADQCSLEVRFPSISRIADVVWLPHSLIFEVQCSSITTEEVQKRNDDYGKLGYTVIWLFHDKRFNRKRVTAAEMGIRGRPHFFTDINADGIGSIYDQFDLVTNGIRSHRLTSLPVNLAELRCLNHVDRQRICLKRIQPRLRSFPFFFSGDLVDIALKDSHPYLTEALALEASMVSSKRPLSIGKVFRHLLQSVFIRPYTIVLQTLLERVSR